MNNPLADDPDPLYFEDYTQDLELSGGSYRVTREEILEFGRRFDPQPLHTDEAMAETGPLGGLVAPGPLTFAIRSALYNQLPVRPVLVAGLGLERLDLTTPVRVDDVLSIRVQVEQTRRSKSKPDQGIVTTRQEVLNQNGEVVMSMLAKMMVRARTAG